MSAFVVSEAHIDYMVRAATVLHYHHSPLAWIWNVDRAAGNYDRETLPRGDHGREIEVGQMLWDENLASVSYRYPDCDGDELPGPIGCSYVYEAGPPLLPRPVDAVTVLKAIACYEYQSCEHNGWSTSQAQAFCEALRCRAISALPGYDDAAWDIPETRTHSVERIGR